MKYVKAIVRKAISNGWALVLVLLLSAISRADAKIKLPAFISDNMVLQQKTNDALWGFAASGSAVTIKVSWTQKTFTTQADAAGKWKITFPAPPAGGPYTIWISDKDSQVTLKNILCGEVWFCGGQSNMEMPVRGFPGQPVSGAMDAISDANNSQIHLFRAERAASEKPLDNVTGSWSESNSESAALFTAVGYAFGKSLQQALHVPIGLIHSNWGGTRIECWMSKDTLKSFSFVNVKNISADSSPYLTPTLLYNAMVAPYLGFAMKGVIWYQGESNRFEPDQYQQLMPAMINSWRTSWGIGPFPFYYVQIAPFFYWNEENNSAVMREAQMNVMKLTKNTGMAVTLDVGGQMDIHPREKFIVGKRLSYWALHNDYGQKGVVCAGPVYKELKTDGKNLKLYFDEAAYGMTSTDTLVSGFQVAGDDHQFFPATAKITGTNEITVSSDQVVHPVAARYGWHNWVVGSLFSTEGLPASSFRTDNWKK